MANLPGVLVSAIGAFIGLSLIAAKRMTSKSRVPYGVFLALGVYVAVFAGPLIPQHLSGS